MFCGYPRPNSTAKSNLLREAEARGVPPERLVFAPFLPTLDEHLARLKLADLFLDTLARTTPTPPQRRAQDGRSGPTTPGEMFASN